MRYGICIALVLTMSAAVHGQSADVSFHDGARLFVDAEIVQAEQVVNAGLAIAPDDAKLLALKELIEEEKEREQSSSDGSQQQEQEENRRQEQHNNSSSGDQAEETENEQSETGEDQESEQQSPPQPDEEPQDPEVGEPDERQRDAAGQENSEQLSRAQALRILQALQNEEEQLLREVQKVKGRPRRVEKDW